MIGTILTKATHNGLESFPSGVIIFCKSFRVVDNGVETVKTYENDVLKSHTVNGQRQGIQHHRHH